MKISYLHYLFFSFVLFLVGGCGLIGNDSDPDWENLDFPVQTGYQLHVSGGDLYVAAGHDGLYVLENANPRYQWEYLGHKVTQGERHVDSGVQAVDVYGDTILVGYVSPPEQEDGAQIGIWRSENAGSSWRPSDEGIRTDELNYSNAFFLARSPHEPERMITSSFGEIYYSDDSGASWQPESSSDFKSGRSILEQGAQWHPANPDVIWTYGESGYFQPFLAKSENAGEFWERYSNVQVPRDNAFFDMAFDASNPELIYVGAQGAVIKSESGGKEWANQGAVTVAFTDPRGNFFHALEAHTQKAGVLFAAAGPHLYVSRDKGNTALRIETPSELTYINDIIYDETTGALYVTGEYGVFRLKTSYIRKGPFLPPN
ncbi:MAG: hypothetical protein U5K69_13970 [Balneolaceae bacterium]|nr:hypothetical protein [Balneolaceae bacterium]